MLELFKETVLAAMLLLSPEIDSTKVQVVLSKDPNYVQLAESLNLPPMLVYGRTFCGNGSEGKLSCVIVVNSCLIEKDAPANRRKLEETILHEYSHVEEFYRNGKSSNHGRAWRKVVREWGIKTTIKSRNLLKSCEYIFE